ncbi:hypothetical protein J6590_057219 [Homalodisca vitripennis]|nr:hypothetical protein J6590_057219 [Homalodisca vitripennis]
MINAVRRLFSKIDLHCKDLNPCASSWTLESNGFCELLNSWNSKSSRNLSLMVEVWTIVSALFSSFPTLEYNGDLLIPACEASDRGICNVTAIRVLTPLGHLGLSNITSSTFLRTPGIPPTSECLGVPGLGQRKPLEYSELYFTWTPGIPVPSLGRQNIPQIPDQWWFSD